MEKKRILITFIESGMGHITSARSISDNLKKYYGDKFEIIDSYIMDEDGDKSLKSWENFIIKQTKNTNRIKGFGNFIFFFLNLMGGLKFMRATHRSVFKKFTNHCMEAFRKRNPDIIVSTHYFLTFAALEYKRKINPNVKVVTYNPDNNVHLWWDNREHLFLVNNETAYYEAIGKRKFNPAFVQRVNFIARDQIVDSNLSRQEYRKKLGIDENKFCVMVADGVYACAKAKKITNELLKSDKPMTIIFLAGKNDKLFKKYNAMKEQGKIKSNIDLIVLPFTREVHEYYAASDVFVTKAGPNAILDSVFMNTPVIASFYGHPIEKATIELFVNEYKMGKAIFKPKKIREQVEQWIDDPTELRQLEENTKVIDKYENGGKKAADLIWHEANRNEVFSEKTLYQNSLYELAGEEKYDTYTTPINHLNVNKKIVYKKLKKPNIFARAYRGFVRGFLWLFAPIINGIGVSFRVKGRKNIKGIKRAISVSNHVSYFDCLWNMQVFRNRKYYITVAPHNYKKGAFGRLLRAGGVVPIASNLSQVRDFSQTVKFLLDKNSFVHFYPEQALWKNYKQSRPLKKGAFHFAVENDVPVVPVVYLFRKHNRVTAEILKPIYPDKSLSKADATVKLQNEVQKAYDDKIIEFYHYDPETYRMNIKNEPIVEKK